jgi:heterogeneous nuclear rnp K-like protein
MSASPNTIPSSAKRPLEEPSSPSGPTDQPDAKRPALDKILKEDKITTSNIKNEEGAPGEEGKSVGTVGNVNVKEEDGTGTASANGNANQESHGDTVVPDAPAASVPLEVQPIQSMASSNGSRASNPHVDESQYLHLRACINTTEAATVIGKGGENVTQIRKMSGAKCTVSDYQRGAIERIVTVSGPVDAVSKAYGLIVRTVNNEPLEGPSGTTSKSYPLRLLIPNMLIGAVIGRNGSRIREIQDVSNAKLNASETTLPLSSERSLIVLGVADAVHIAVYYISQTLMEQYTEKYGGPAASNYATRRGDQPNPVGSGMIVQPYHPKQVGGQWGHPSSYHQHDNRANRTPANPYGIPNMHSQQPQQAYATPTMHYPAAASPARGGYAGMGPQPANPYGAHQPAQPMAHAGPAQPVAGMGTGQTTTQQIYIPNDMVGAIIGKGGSKINEIRQLSGSIIKINEPQDNSNERLVTISGTQDANQMALYMLYSRLGELNLGRKEGNEDPN